MEVLPEPLSGRLTMERRRVGATDSLLGGEAPQPPHRISRNRGPAMSIVMKAPDGVDTPLLFLGKSSCNPFGFRLDFFAWTYKKKSEHWIHSSTNFASNKLGWRHALRGRRLSATPSPLP